MTLSSQEKLPIYYNDSRSFVIHTQYVLTEIFYINDVESSYHNY